MRVFICRIDNGDEVTNEKIDELEVLVDLYIPHSAVLAWFLEDVYGGTDKV